MPRFARVIVVAPTRSACVNLKHLLGLKGFPETLLLREKSAELFEAIANLYRGGFGIVAGTGTGKSAAIRKLCNRLFGSYGVDLVTMEHQAEVATSNKVVVVTPGVALLWAATGRITRKDLVVYDEIHQTSAHLELTMALNKRIGVTAVWMSATINPEIYQDYLEARTTIECYAYDPKRRAEVIQGYDLEMHLDEHLPRLARGKCGVAVFVPTRAEAEAMAKKYHGQFGLHADFYHGGEPADKLQQFLTGDIPRPYAIFMTAAGASSLNIAGLTAVVIVDSRYTGVIKKGQRTTARVPLDNNTLLQMAGRVNGRAVNGEVHIIGTRHVALHQLEPTAPEFELGGDLEQLALNIAKQGVTARGLPLIGKIDMDAYDAIERRLTARGAVSIEDGRPRLTAKGQRLQKLPVPVAWGELLLKAVDDGNDDLLRVTASAASLPQIYQVTLRNKWHAHRDGRVIYGSDHLTVANILGEAIAENAEDTARGYKFGASFGKWCKDNHYSQRELRNGALLLHSIYRALGKQLPTPDEFIASLDVGSELYKDFVRLLLEVASMEYVCGPEHHSTTARIKGNDRNGVSSGNSTIGTFRFWEYNGYSNATIEGTDVSRSVVEQYARRTISAIGGLTATQDLRVYCKPVFAGEPLRQHLPPASRFSSRLYDDYEERLEEQRRGTPLVIDLDGLKGLPLAPVVEITAEAVDSGAWKSLDSWMPADQEVSWTKPEGYSFDKFTGALAEGLRVIRSYLNAKALETLSVADIPALDLSNGTAGLPDIIERQHSVDALTGEPLTVYGVVELTKGYDDQSKVVSRWVTSAEEAERIHAHSKEVLAAIGQAELERHQREARIDSVLRRAKALLRDASVPAQSRGLLMEYSRRPWGPYEEWFTAAEAAIAAAESDKNQAQKLARECQAVLTELRRVVDEDNSDVDDDTYEALEDLAKFRLGEMTAEQLREWRTKANRELEAARKPKESASESDLRALAAHFGRK